MEFHNEQVQKILNQLHAGGFPSAVVAGGVVRDTLFGRDVKDIDVFISLEDMEHSSVNQMSFALGREVLQYNVATYSEIPDVHSVYDVSYPSMDDGANPEEYIMSYFSELPVQIIVMDEGMSPKDRIDTFDFGFCQVGYDGKNVFCSENFLIDRDNKTITLVYCENQYEWTRSMARYDRLSLKYPDFKLVAAPQTHYPVLEIENKEEPIQLLTPSWAII